ncbi:MAG: hypothetical protein ACRDH9_06415 [Actinomycetota bacterium]
MSGPITQAVDVEADELAFTGVNLAFLVGGLIGLVLLGLSLNYAGRGAGRT